MSQSTMNRVGQLTADLTEVPILPVKFARLVSASHEIVTSDDVQFLLDLCDPEYQRRLRASHVSILAEAMSNHAFPLGHYALAECPWDPQCPVKLIDGMHTAHAQRESGESIYAEITKWVVPRREDWPLFWACWGADTKLRTKEDEIKQLVNCGTLSTISPTGHKSVSLFARGAILYAKHIQKRDISRHTMIEKCMLTNEFPEAFHVYSNCRAQAPDKLLVAPSGISAAVIATCEVSRVHKWCSEFWMEASTGLCSILDKWYPPYLLHQVLRDIRRESKGGSRTNPLDLYTMSVNAWNAWLANIGLQFLRGRYRGVVGVPNSQGEEWKSHSRRSSISYGPIRTVA